MLYVNFVNFANTDSQSHNKWQYKRKDIVPDSFTEFSNNTSQGKEGLVDGAAFTESVPRVLTRLLWSCQVNKVL